jgi:hypothetical protein
MKLKALLHRLVFLIKGRRRLRVLTASAADLLPVRDKKSVCATLCAPSIEPREAQPAVAPPPTRRITCADWVPRASQIKAAFKAGQLSREEAIRQLQALGLLDACRGLFLSR